MSAFRNCLLAALLLLAGVPVHAQWSGALDMSGGFGYLPPRIGEENDMALVRILGQGTARVGYRSSEFVWNASLSGGYDRQDTDAHRLTLTGLTDTEKPSQLESLYKYGQQRSSNVSFKTDARWTPERGRIYESWLQVSGKADKSENATVKEKGVIVPGMEDLSDVSMTFESPVNSDTRVQGGLKAVHHLGTPRRILGGELTMERRLQEKDGEWTLYKDTDKTEGVMKVYRLTPSTDMLNGNFTVHYMDSVVNRGPWRLVIDPGLRIAAENAHYSNSGSTLIDPERDIWRDSTSIRENFDFLSARLEPYVAFNFQWNKLQAHADYSPQLYFRQLNSGQRQEDLHFVRPSPVGSGWISWTFSPVHKLTLRNSLSVKHPSHTQICWFDRQGGYLRQLYRGNENLKSTLTAVVGLEYELHYKRFQSTTRASYTRKTDEIDQTYSKEEIDGHTYKVFTWVNSSDSRVYSVTQQLGWRGKVLRANVGVTYNGSVRVQRETDKKKESTDWRAWADATLILPKGLTLQGDVSYRSDVATFFTLFKQYCSLNLRVEKAFKKVTVYLQGKDLLDDETNREFTSADEDEMWGETIRQNRRMAVLGFRWRF